jgi:GNAT superfamily N-acetyltransferase
MEIRLYREATDQAALRSFNIAIFGSDTPEPIRSDEDGGAVAANPYASGPAITAIAIGDGVIIGHLTSTPFGLWIGAEEMTAWWVSGFHVLPEARRLGVGKKLVACLTAALPFASAVVVVEPSLKAFLANGWTWPGKIHEHICVLRPHKFAALLTAERLERFLPHGGRRLADLSLRLARAPLAWSISGTRALLRLTAPRAEGAHLEGREAQQFGEGVDELWRKARGAFGMTQVRSSRNLNWQFPAERGWRKREYLKDGVLSAWALYTVRDYTSGPLRGLRALNIIDVFWDPGGLGLAAQVIDDLVTVASGLDADIVMASGEHPQLHVALRRRGFLRVPRTVFVGFWSRDARHDLRALYKSAYITRGYADAAGGLAPA